MQRLIDNRVHKSQLTLPLCFGGMGLRTKSELKAHALLFAAVAMTEKAMHAGHQQYRPFSGTNAPELTQVWQAILAEGVESKLWAPDTLTIDQKCINEVLPGVQHMYARLVVKGDTRLFVGHRE